MSPWLFKCVYGWCGERSVCQGASERDGTAAGGWW